MQFLRRWSPAPSVGHLLANIVSIVIVIVIIIISIIIAIAIAIAIVIVNLR